MNKKIIIYFVTVIIVVALAMSVSVKYYGNYQLNQETKKLNELAKNNPNGQDILKKIEKFTADLRDGDKENDFTAWVAIASQKNLLGDLPGAEKGYLKALELQSNDNLALWNLSTVYIHMEKFQDAVTVLKRLIALDPYTARYHVALADIFRYSLKDEISMVDTLLYGLSKVESSNDLLAYLAEYYGDKNDSVKAIEYYDKLVNAHPENTAAKKELEQLQLP